MDKIQKLQKTMPSSVEALIVCDPANRFYLTGMKSSAGTVLVTRQRAWLLIDFRYLEEAEKKVKNCTVLEQKELYAQLATLLRKQQIKKVSVLADRMTLVQCRALREGLALAEIDDTEMAAQWMERMRMEKDDEEIECHRRAQQITDRTFDYICGIIRPGMTELEISQEIGTHLTALGSDDRNFNFIVASGTNSSLPHGFATRKVIQKGDFVTMDFGAVCGGYLADMTRTVAVGSVTEEQKNVYEIVRGAQERAFAEIRPGACCRDVDAAARDYIYSRGYRGCFSHGLGHSIGVEVHENPRFNETCMEKLVPGVVITVEPGIYIRQRFGVRIEDMIVVRENGFENLAKSPKKLIIL
ncbi:Creatinase [Marvinbryantia formatexigens DSM 14469]|uniref:Creatinase n=1 Tax=Marvinbryantia formatexigens DSM 14469 TaxID=478749 RepID=C6LJG9_9FIRM|nr:Xaa-Pro peptidase family protein [Marvinbryantia formatexigens]EET59283.1 Creatinase [Marvinbryantia formatexigens DSM 14469]UWO25388.1 Xaa-Pro peptidase family protein [Marvinbryantia formatexigens DSM 14469]SDG73289.1 Xaa-Pro aminopeptidase [Marvinbryantia formatexigens]